MKHRVSPHIFAFGRLAWKAKSGVQQSLHHDVSRIGRSIPPHAPTPFACSNWGPCPRSMKLPSEDFVLSGCKMMPCYGVIPFLATPLLMCRPVDYFLQCSTNGNCRAGLPVSRDPNTNFGPSTDKRGEKMLPAKRLHGFTMMTRTVVN